jgi:hypothetical protein
MRIAFGRTRPGIGSLFHLCAEHPDLFLKEWDPESDTEFIHLCAKLDLFLEETDLELEPQFIYVQNQVWF